MHELSITQSILNIALDTAQNAGAKKINKIKIAMGEMTSYVPKYIQEYFNIVSDGTIAHNAALEFRCVPAAADCLDCGNKTQLKGYSFRCGHCGSQNLKLISGREFLVEGIDVEE